MKTTVKRIPIWWTEAASEDDFRAKQAAEQPRMNQNKEGRAWIALRRQLSGGRPYSPPKLKG